MDYEVSCLDNFDTYYDPEIKKQHIEKFLPDSRFKLVNGVLRDIDLFKNTCRCGLCISWSGSGRNTYFCQGSPKFSRSKATGTLNLLDVAQDTNVRKIINASSSSVFGKTKYLPFDEEHPTEPVSP
jgi:UDP-glucose 4-epimerase